MYSNNDINGYQGCKIVVLKIQGGQSSAYVPMAMYLPNSLGGANTPSPPPPQMQPWPYANTEDYLQKVVWCHLQSLLQQHTHLASLANASSAMAKM